MIPDLEFYLPDNVFDACKILSEDNHAKIIAGGTDIIPGFHIKSPRFRNISALVDIQKIQELKKVESNSEYLSIGACLSFSDIISNPMLNEKVPLIVKAAKTVGSLQIRNRATIGGNFINNAPCADNVPPLLVYDAKIKISSIAGERILSLEKFLLEPYKTQLKPDEIVTRILIPFQSSKMNGDFLKLGRRRGVSISRISIAILLKTENKKITDLKIACGAVTPVGIRLRELEKEFVGKRTSEKSFKEIATGVGEKILDVTGLRWSSEYKIPVLQQMIYQLLKGTGKQP